MKLGATTAVLTRRSVTGVDEYGNDITGTQQVTLTGCMFHPRMSGSGSVEAGSQVISGGWLYTPAGTDITAADSITVDGVTYEIDGEPGNWATPTGSIAFQQVALRRVTG